MSNEAFNCPHCAASMQPGYVYLRGIGAALFWSEQGDTGALSRRNLQQLELDQISARPTGAQAVIEARRCPQCALIAFRGA